jgi:hypothetical protein
MRMREAIMKKLMDSQCAKPQNSYAGDRERAAGYLRPEDQVSGGNSTMGPIPRRAKPAIASSSTHLLAGSTICCVSAPRIYPRLEETKRGGPGDDAELLTSRNPMRSAPARPQCDKPRRGDKSGLLTLRRGARGAALQTRHSVYIIRFDSFPTPTGGFSRILGERPWVIGYGLHGFSSREGRSMMVIGRFCFFD